MYFFLGQPNETPFISRTLDTKRPNKYLNHLGSRWGWGACCWGLGVACKKVHTAPALRSNFCFANILSELTGLSAIFRLLNVHGGIAYCLLRRIHQDFIERMVRSNFEIIQPTSNISKSIYELKKWQQQKAEQTDDVSFGEKWFMKKLQVSTCCGNRKKLQNESLTHTSCSNKQTAEQASQQTRNSSSYHKMSRHLHGGVHVRALVVTVASTVFRGSVLQREGETINISP